MIHSDNNSSNNSGNNSFARGVAFITMGCAKNEVDSAQMATRLVDAGYFIEEDPARADVVIVNTCSFIQAATEESIEAILNASEFSNIASGAAKLVVSGCMPARYGFELDDELPEVHRFVPCADEEQIVEIVDALFEIERHSELSSCHSERREESQTSTALKATPSAYVKISDGCDRFCSYCTIPYIRGRYHSFTAEEIEHEIAKQIAAGAREIVLIAQDTGRWGTDFVTPSSLAKLLEQLAQAHSETWFRVMYIQPEGISDELIDCVSRYENICSYFDIPFQHCDEEILKRMNRKGSAEEFLDLIERIRARIPDVTLRTTLIAGFPGETQVQFEALCDFLEEACLDYVGVFPYSQEEGTRAATLDEQIDEDEKLSRAQQLRDLADAVSSTIIAERIGRELDVLICGIEEDGQLFGRAQCQAPDVDGVTYVEKGTVGEFVRVRLVDTLLYEMEGEVVS